MSQAHPTDGRTRRSVRALGLGLLIGSGGACAREPLPQICPTVDEGELVISELRRQSDPAAVGHYIEVYNDAGKTVDLQGLRVRVRSSTEQSDEASRDFFVRESLEVPAGGYAVIGPGLADDKRGWIDYVVGWDISGGDPEDDDYPTDLLSPEWGAIEIEACGELIDEVFVALDTYPETGTLACGNAELPPSAEDNDTTQNAADASILDNPGCWCIDDQDAEGQPILGVAPGSPGGVNRCE